MHRTTQDARSIAERDQPAMVSRRYPLHRGGSDRATTLPVVGQNRRAGLVRTGRQRADRQIPLSLIRYFTVTRPGDRIVFVATASAPREPALPACHFLIDWLKTEAPFWKSEETPPGERWVEARAADV